MMNIDGYTKQNSLISKEYFFSLNIIFRFNALVVMINVNPYVWKDGLYNKTDPTVLPTSPYNCACE